MLRYVKPTSTIPLSRNDLNDFERTPKEFFLLKQAVTVTLPREWDKNPTVPLPSETKRGALFVYPRWHPKVPVPVTFGMAVPRRVLWLPPMAERGKNVGCILLLPKKCVRRGLTLNFDSQNTFSTNVGTIIFT